MVQWHPGQESVPSSLTVSIHLTVPAGLGLRAMNVCASPATLQLLTQSRFIITELEHKGSLWGRFPEAGGVSSLAGLRLVPS